MPDEKKGDFTPVVPSKEDDSKRVLVIYGNNTMMRKKVLKVLEDLKVEPILYQAKVDAARPLSQRTKEFKNVCFVIIILYPDDQVSAPDVSPEYGVLCAGQNVVFEFGYWMGKLGREHTFILYHEKKKFRLPTGYHDAIYTKYDDKDLWKKELEKRLSEI